MPARGQLLGGEPGPSEVGAPSRERRLALHGGVAGRQAASQHFRGCCDRAPGVCAAARLRWLNAPCPLAIALSSLEARVAGHEARETGVLPAPSPVSAVSLSQQERGPGCLFLSHLPHP